MGKPRRSRDSQQGRVYSSEFLAFGKAEDPEGDLDGSYDQAQAFVDKVVASAWFKRNAPRHWHSLRGEPRMRIARDYEGRTRSFAGSSLIRHRGKLYPALFIARPHLNKRWLLLHEICHWITPHDAGHGREYARIYLSAVKRFLGDDEARKLRAAFKTKRVKYRATPNKGEGVTRYASAAHHS
jgi:hypothetical protein